MLIVFTASLLLGFKGLRFVGWSALNSLKKVLFQFGIDFYAKLHNLEINRIIKET